MSAKKTRATLHVLFDTNSILASGFENIVSKKAADAIKDHSRHGDLDIIWILPEVVKMEREYQMRNDFRHVLKPTKQAESLFEADWNVSQDRINDAIEARIRAQLSELKLSVMACDSSNVDWASLTRNSAFRLPPFQAGDTEKGFRDALMCETFYQLVDSLSGKATAVLVSKDGLVSTAVNQRLRGARIVADIEGLCDEINLRVSNVDGPTATLLEEKASKLMYDFDNPDAPTSLWNREKLYDDIWNRFGAQIRAYAKDGNWQRGSQTLGPTRLVRKEGTRTFFSTTYTAEGSALVWVPDSSPAQLPTTTSGVLGLGSLSGDAKLAPLSGLFNSEVRGNALVASLQPSTLLTGTTLGNLVPVALTPAEVQIHWSATYSKHKRLTHAKVELTTLVPPPQLPTDLS